MQPAAGDQRHGEALPPAPPPRAVVEDERPAPVRSGSNESPAPENPKPAGSAPSSPRIAACVAAASGQSSHTTAAGDLSPSQPSHGARKEEGLPPAARAPQDVPSAQNPPSAVDAGSDSNAPPGAVSGTDAAAAAATVAAAAAKASPHSESPAASGPWGVQLAALLPAERHKPGSEVLTSAQTQERPHSPPPSQPHVTQPGSAGGLGPAASAAPLFQGPLPGSEMAAVRGVCQPHPEASLHRTLQAVVQQHHPSEDVPAEDKVEDPPTVRRNSYGLEGASVSQRLTVCAVPPPVFTMASPCVRAALHQHEVSALLIEIC